MKHELINFLNEDNDTDNTYMRNILIPMQFKVQHTNTKTYRPTYILLKNVCEPICTVYTEFLYIHTSTIHTYMHSYTHTQ